MSQICVYARRLYTLYSLQKRQICELTDVLCINNDDGGYLYNYQHPCAHIVSISNIVYYCLEWMPSLTFDAFFRSIPFASVLWCCASVSVLLLFLFLLSFGFVSFALKWFHIHCVFSFFYDFSLYDAALFRFMRFQDISNVEQWEYWTSIYIDSNNQAIQIDCSCCCSMLPLLPVFLLFYVDNLFSFDFYLNFYVYRMLSCTCSCLLRRTNLASLHIHSTSVATWLIFRKQNRRSKKKTKNNKFC